MLTITTPLVIIIFVENKKSFWKIFTIQDYVNYKTRKHKKGMKGYINDKLNKILVIM